MDNQLPDHVDVLVVGAGIAGINAAYHLTTEYPDHSLAVIDAHHSFGGTWLIHTYPGVRSDTELYTLGFSFKPWTGAPYAGGPDIQRYLGETIDEFGLSPHMHFGHTVVAAAWSEATQTWTVTGTSDVAGSGTRASFTMTTRFLWLCNGYYDHNQGHVPTWPGMDSYRGRWIHPQAWPENPDLDGSKVVVIGSGATMATLVPAIADRCEHVTVVQRSPTYFFQSPNTDPLADQLRLLDIPEEWIHEIARRKAVADMQAMTAVQMAHPDLAKAALIKAVADQLPDGYDVDTHFTPRHVPHEQRICRILDGDLFEAIRSGKVTMVTDEIATFTPDGLTTKDGTEIEADVVITATGFDLAALGGIAFTVDGALVDPAQTVTYRGVLFTGLPNLAWTFGSLRLSWTMRADLVNQFVVRILRHLDAIGASSVVPHLRPEDAGQDFGPYIDPVDFNPGYAQRSRHRMPRSGSAQEWRLDLDFWREQAVLPTVDLDDGCLVFRGTPARVGDEPPRSTGTA